MWLTAGSVLGMDLDRWRSVIGVPVLDACVRDEFGNGLR